MTIEQECREAEDVRRERYDRVFHSPRCYMCDGTRTIEYEDDDISCCVSNCPVCNKESKDG